MKLLVLAGSAEARQIAMDCCALGAEVRALVSEPPKGPNPMPVPCTLIDIAQPDAVAAAMANCDAVLDASHGFDRTMSDLGYTAASALGLPFLIYQRPGWSAGDAPGAQTAPDVAAAMGVIRQGARVFSATGWGSLPDCATFQGEVLFLRQTSPHGRPAPYGFVQLCFGTPPFTVQSETGLFKNLEIDTLMCRNLGGAASRPKVDAAVALGLRVILIDRPALPKGAPVVDTVDAATAWVSAL
ncbi:MAG: precorrin-6A/cobalt-precorrin-6A reductase [Sulfitobacter sp.]